MIVEFEIQVVETMLLPESWQVIHVHRLEMQEKTLIRISPSARVSEVRQSILRQVHVEPGVNYPAAGRHRLVVGRKPAKVSHIYYKTVGRSFHDVVGANGLNRYMGIFWKHLTQEEENHGTGIPPGH